MILGGIFLSFFFFWCDLNISWICIEKCGRWKKPIVKYDYPNRKYHLMIKACQWHSEMTEGRKKVRQKTFTREISQKKSQTK